MTRRLARLFPRPWPAIAALALLAACASGPDVAPVPPYDAAAVVAAIRAAGAAGDSELVVNPLGANEVGDLREQAERHIAAQRHAEAAEALDHALRLDPDNPELLQLRAEVALLQRQPAQAGRFAERAIAIGTEVGPLCRRHWETVAQVRTILAPPPATSGTVEAGATAAAKAASTAAEARRQRDACTVAAPPRY